MACTSMPRGGQIAAVVLTFVTACAAGVSAYYSIQSWQQAKLSADFAARTYQLQTPSLLLSAEFDKEQPVLIMRASAQSESFRAAFFVPMILSNKSISPTGLARITFGLTGVRFLPPMHEWRQVGHGITPPSLTGDREYALIGSQVEAKIVERSDASDKIVELPTLQPNQTIRAALMLSFPFTPYALVGSLCAKADEVQIIQGNNRLSTCNGEGPWKFRSYSDFEDVVRGMSRGFDVFGQRGYDSPSASGDDLSFHISLRLSSGHSCALDILPHSRRHQESVDCQ